MIEAKVKNNSRSAASRRLLPRHHADMRVRIALSTPVPVILHARAADLSTGGMSVVLPQESSSTAVAMIGFRTPECTEDVWFHVRLRHRSGFRCGFQFVDATAEQKSLLRQLCRALAA